MNIVYKWHPPELVLRIWERDNYEAAVRFLAQSQGSGSFEIKDDRGTVVYRGICYIRGGAVVIEDAAATTFPSLEGLPRFHRDEDIQE